MRLTPKAVRAIERGAKTEHRVLVADPAVRQRRNGTTYISQPFHPTAGQTIPVQPEQRDTTGAITADQVRVTVTHVTRELLGDITPAGARAEGHATIAAFADQWMRIHTDTWPPQTEALCKNCDGFGEHPNHDGETVPCEQCDLGVVTVDTVPPPVEILGRFERRHAHHLVWVVQFELLSDVPRYLNKRAYLPPTTSLSEALEPVEILGPPRPDWRQRADTLHREALRDRDGARLAGLDRIAADIQAEEIKARAEGRDISSLTRETLHKLEQIKRKLISSDKRAA